MEKAQWIEKKANLMENLLRLTAMMQDSLLKNEEKKFEESLQARNTAFENLLRHDAEGPQEATAQDELWMRQLKMMESSDLEIMKHLRKHQESLLTELEAGRKEFVQYLEYQMADSKGQRIEARG